MCQYAVSNALFPDCDSAVAFCYSHFDVQPQYDPSDEINVGDYVEVTVEVQAGGDGPPVPSKQGTEVPGRLLHPSL